jgi:hypothetical protein
VLDLPRGGVLADGHVVEREFLVVDADVALFERDVPVAHGLDLRAHELDPDLELIADEVVVPRPPILDRRCAVLGVFLLGLGHEL